MIVKASSVMGETIVACSRKYFVGKEKVRNFIICLVWLKFIDCIKVTLSDAVMYCEAWNQTLLSVGSTYEFQCLIAQNQSMVKC
jgi:hypothetical protein